MPLRNQVVSIPFVKGPETKIDPKLVDSAQLLALTNETFSDSGSLTRRDPWVTLPGSTVSSAPQGAWAYNNELLTISSGQLSTYSPGRDTLNHRGNVSQCTLSKSQITRATRWADQVDAAYLNYTSGLICYVWRESTVTSTTVTTTTAIYAEVRDYVTGALCGGPTILMGGAGLRLPRVAPVFGANLANTGWVVVWGSGTDLKGTFVTTGGAANAATTLRTDFSAVAPMDMMGIGATYGSSSGPGANAAILAYASSNATNSVFALLLGAAAGSISTISGPISCGLQATIPSTELVGMAIAPYAQSPSVLGVFALASTGASQGVWAGTLNINGAFTVITAGTALANKDATAAPDAGTPSSITAVLSGTTMMVYSDNAGNLGGGGTGGATDPIRAVGINSANTVVVAASTVNTSLTHTNGPCGPYIAGKAFVYNSAVYLPAYVGSVVQGDANLQCTWFLLTPGTAAPMAKALYGTFGLWTVNNAPPYMAAPPTTIWPAASTFICPALERGQLAFDGGSGVNVTPVGVSQLTLNMAPAYTAAQVGECMFFSGGFLAQYDGQQCVEAGFHLFPEALTCPLVAAGSLTGTFQYCAAYEWVDGQGQRHQSALSPVVTINAAAENINVFVPTINLTAKTNINVVIFRTKASGTTFYRLNTITSPLANAATAMTAAYLDSTSDTVLGTHEVLYTAGGALENLGPPSCTSIVNHQNRLWMAGLEDPFNFAFSQARVISQGLAFSDVLGGTIPTNVGGLTAVGSLDDKAILYTSTRKFVVFGDGPNAAGLQGTYSVPQPLPSDVGCIEPRSIVNINRGQMYQSGRGIYLLNRSLQDEYIGSPVEGLIGTADIINSAVVLTNKAQVRFSVTTANGTSARALVYNTQFDQWAYFTNTVSTTGIAGACVWNGLWTFANIGGLAMSQDDPATLDNLDFGLTPITASISTAWIRLGALNGFQRVRRLLLTGTTGASTLTIAVFVDYKESAIDTVTIPTTGTLNENGILVLRHHLETQKCQAIRFDFTDLPLASSYVGTDFSGMTLELGMKKGSAKLPAANTL